MFSNWKITFFSIQFPVEKEIMSAAYILMSISVLITYHNEREMLKECLESLQSGSCLPDEILIYDDASTFPPDGFIPPGLPVRILRGEVNLGPGRGRNLLLEQATGEFIHFHDSDDWFHHDWCMVVNERLKNCICDVLFTEVTSSSTGYPSFLHPFMGYEIVLPNLDLTAFALEQSLLVPCATIRRECAIKIGGFRAGLWQSEDKDFYIRLAASGVSWQVEKRPLICIRNRADSRSKQQAEVWKDGLKCLNYAHKELPSRYGSNIANAAAKCAYQLYGLGETNAAREAFQLSKRLGGASYSWRSLGFRLVAKFFGAETAEVCSHIIQKLRTRYYARVR